MTISALTNRIMALVATIRWRTEVVTSLGLALMRRPFTGKVEFVAITGSAGKTTTKDLSAGLLSCVGAVTKTQQSSNDSVMVARTIASIRRKDRYAVLEVSGGESGAMDWPLRLFKPRIAVVTLFQREHARSGFGLEDIANEKFRLVNALPENGTAILNIDDPLLRQRGEEWDGNVIWVGWSEGAHLRLLECKSAWPQPLTLRVAYDGEQFAVPTRLYGEHLALSVLCALAVALATGMELPVAIANLQTLEPSEGRMQVVTRSDGVTFVRDDWKAPYWSLDAPMAFIRDAAAPRKAMVIGTLSDYSRSASKLYPQVAEKALEIADLVIFVGTHAYRAIKRATAEQRERLRGFSELRQASMYLSDVLRPGDLVLLKGSSRVDHLVRLIFDREDPIACWQVRCGKSQFCTSCPRLYDFTLAGSDTSSALVDGTDEALPAIPLGDGRFILVGLGNPGDKYRLTRHNAGHLALDAFAQQQDITWQQTAEGQVAEGLLEGERVVLVKPAAAINHSGSTILRMLGSEELARVVLVHDDMDLEVGTMKVRRGGGDGGHLGVRSMIAAGQTQDFCRIRLGVRPPGDVRKSWQLVHQSLSEREQQQLVAAFEAGLQQLPV
ncbi:aminoacyl-tRNA hydrolase [Haliea sp.]|uniref:aminoacyl-tRNA hydrolase n=1 Tax=Haliea sp. TaxID=1932666 RepID=UPI000C5A9D68|nr:aminoacyl-tRNA hydrolase [Haliea sp.]MAD62048.1 peptidyl-tRNA hydrolase [Haliea sp.]